MPLEVREAWLDQVREDIVDPGRRIVDPHHHFFSRGGDFPFYDLDELWADTATHNVEQTIYVQCWEGYRSDGPDEMKPVGETDWVDGIAARARQFPESSQIGGIVAAAELRLGAAVRPVLEAHREASALFRGIRQAAAWDADEGLMSMPGIDHADLYSEPKFRDGFAILGEMGLVFDAYHYHHQNPVLTKLAHDFPDVSIVLDHLGTPLGVGAYANRQDEIFERWKLDLKELADCENVSVKLGGLAMPWNGFAFEENELPPSSDELVAKQSRYYHYAIETFGPERCMFESNFPVDKCAVSYSVLWNAFKKMAADYTESEKDSLFRATATRVYGL